MSADWRIVVHQHGGPEQMQREEITLAPPAAGQVIVRHEAIGINYIDVYHRTGLYPQNLPIGLGVEAAGIVEAVGEGVDQFRVGQKVGYCTGIGSYSTARLIGADQLIAIPDTISADLAAASLLKGLTAEFLIFRCAELTAGSTALVHAAAGGVGQILVQWLHAIGVRVIAHAGSPAKAEIARAAGADHALSCPYAELAEQVRAITDGIGVDASLDGVGADSWQASLSSLKRRGLMVTFGNASGPVPPFTALDLQRQGSLFVTRPTLFDYVAQPEEKKLAAARLFDAIETGQIKVAIGQRFTLADAANAHRALEARTTTGSTLLIP
jgi:NADPH2:quinone reductase